MSRSSFPSSARARDRSGSRWFPLACALAFLVSVLLAMTCLVAPAAGGAATGAPAGDVALGAADAAAPAPSTAIARARWSIGFGPYFAPADPEHWTDPKGTSVEIIDVAAPPCDNALLGIEVLDWQATYRVSRAAGFDIARDTRVRGNYTAFGPVVVARLTRGPFEPWVSGALVAVWGHLEWPHGLVPQADDVRIDDRWTGTLAVGAGVNARLWRDGGVQLRYENVPVAPDFGALSHGSGDAGVSTVVLSLFRDFGPARRPETP